MTRWLVEQDRPRSTAALADAVGLSERVVRYRLGVVEKYLASEEAVLTRQRGRGLLVEADEETRRRIMADLADRMGAPRVYTPEEREHLLVAALLWAAPDVISLDDLHSELAVSKASARRDLARAEPWLERNGVPLLRKPGKGLMLLASERQIRRALVQLFLESVPSDVLTELTTTDIDDARLVYVRVPVGVRERFAELPLLRCSRALANSSLQLADAGGNNDLVFALYLAVTAARCAADHPISLDPGQYVSLRDHPATETVAELADGLLADTLDGTPTEEIAGLTEYLLGLNALGAVPPPPADVDAMADHVLDRAGRRLHLSLTDDAELRHGLSMHLSRLLVRLRHGLPVHNPLLADVKERYGDVFTVAAEALAELSPDIGGTLNDDEIAFVTMYLSGAMERANLRPRKRALVVCPSGMATAWVLVARIQTEFPELSLVQVLSASAFAERDEVEFDLVISTVPVDGAEVPVVVVNPLLPDRDVRAVGALI
ncbi:MAG: PRD domain-containing protein [Actinomycetota bacterium]